DVEVVEDAVGEAEADDVVTQPAAVLQRVGLEAQEVAGGVDVSQYDGAVALQVPQAAAVELVVLDVLPAQVDVELALPEGLGSLEEDGAEGLGAALEHLELGVVPVGEAGGRRDH